METSVLYRCAGDIIYNDQEPVPGHISDVQLKMYSETSNFLQYLKPLTPQNPYFFGQIRSLCKYNVCRQNRKEIILLGLLIMLCGCNRNCPLACGVCPYIL